MGQKATDAVSGSGGDAGKEGDSMLKQASDTVSSGVEQAKDALGMNREFSTSS